MTVEDSRDGRLLRFEAETGEDGIVSTEVAAQLLLAEIDLSTFFGEKIRNLKTSHSVTVREGWVMSASLAGLRTLNNQSWWWRQNACDDDHNEDKVVEGVTDNWHSPVLSPSVLSRGLVALLVGLDPRIVGNKYRFIHQNIFSLRAWSYPSDQWHQE